MTAGLRILLIVLGCVMVVAGAATVIRGADAVLDSGAFSPSVDSEMRFYAAWYALAGGVLLNAARAPERSAAIVRFVGAGFLIAACGRAIGIATVGRPHSLFIALMAIEFVLPVVLIPWQRALERRGTR